MRRNESRRSPRVFLLVSFLGILTSSSSIAGEPSRRERRQWADAARQAYLLKDYNGAVRNYELACSHGAVDKDLRLWLPLAGRAYEATENLQKALVAYQQAQSLSPKSVDRRLDLARVYAKSDLYDRAIVIYREILKKDKRRQDISLALAQLYFESGKMKEAQDQTKLYLDWEPRDLSAQRLMARVEAAQGLGAQAAHRWEGILAQDPTAEDYFALGELWARQNEYELAEAAYKKAETLGADSPRLSLQWGVVYWQNSDLAKARAFFNRALAQNPQDAAALFFLALVERDSQKKKEALEQMRRAQAQSPSAYVKNMAQLFLDEVNLE